jgi:hypothetical protein
MKIFLRAAGRRVHGKRSEISRSDAHDHLEVGMERMMDGSGGYGSDPMSSGAEMGAEEARPARKRAGRKKAGAKKRGARKAAKARGRRRGRAKAKARGRSRSRAKKSSRKARRR